MGIYHITMTTGDIRSVINAISAEFDMICINYIPHSVAACVMSPLAIIAYIPVGLRRYHVRIQYIRFECGITNTHCPPLEQMSVQGSSLEYIDYVCSWSISMCSLR